MEQLTRIQNHILAGSLQGDVCRACLKDIEDPINLFTEHHIMTTDTILIKDIFQKTSSIKPVLGDQLPNVLCNMCFKECVTAYEFFNKCQSSDATLKKSFETLELKQIAEIDNEETLIFVFPNNEIVLLESRENSKVKNDKMLTAEDALEDETKLNSENEKFNFCFLCENMFMNEYELKMHVEMHSDFKMSPQTFPFVEEQTTNQYETSSKDTMKTVCFICKDGFESMSLLQGHITSQHGNEIEMYTCKNCKKMCQVDSNEKLIGSCSICDKCGLFIQNDKFEMHKLVHDYSKLHKNCILCNKRYSRESLRNRNYYQNFNRKRRDKVYTCNYCQMDFHQKERLKTHIYGKHIKIDLYSCEICDKKFQQIGRLNAHSIVHTRERKNQCDICGNRFVDGKALKLHQRLHSGERPYPCRFCGERFISSSRLIAHTKSKHMEKKEECPICHKKYHLRTCVNQHMIKVHKKVNIKKAD